MVDQGHTFGGCPAFEILQDLGDDRGKRDGLEVELDAARFQFRNGEQVFDEQPEPLSVAVNGLQEPGGDFGVVTGAIEERFDAAFDEGKRGTEFMADVGNELLAGILKLLEAGQVMKDQNGAVAATMAVQDSGGVNLQPALVRPRQLQLKAQHLFLRVEGTDERG